MLCQQPGEGTRSSWWGGGGRRRVQDTPHCCVRETISMSFKSYSSLTHYCYRVTLFPELMLVRLISIVEKTQSIVAYCTSKVYICIPLTQVSTVWGTSPVLCTSLISVSMSPYDLWRYWYPAVMTMGRALAGWVGGLSTKVYQHCWRRPQLRWLIRPWDNTHYSWAFAFHEQCAKLKAEQSVTLRYISTLTMKYEQTIQ